MSIHQIIAQGGTPQRSMAQKMGEYAQMGEMLRKRRSNEKLQGLLAGGANPQQLAQSGYLVEAQQLASLNKPVSNKPQYGVDRGAVSQELYDRAYRLLNRTQRSDVNETLQKRKVAEAKAGASNINMPKEITATDVSNTAISLEAITGGDANVDGLDANDKIAMSVDIANEVETIQAIGKSEGKIISEADARIIAADSLKKQIVSEPPKWLENFTGVLGDSTKEWITEALSTPKYRPSINKPDSTSIDDLIPTITDQSQYDSLKSGDIFIDSEDGKKYRKP